MTRSTRTALLVAIILLLAGGVATAVVRESRDESSTAVAPAITVPDAPGSAAQPAQTTPTTGAPVPTTVASTSPSSVPAAVPSTAAGDPSGASSGAAPTSTTVPPLTAMPNTGGESLAALGILLVAAGLLGWRVSRQRRPTG